MGPDPILKTGPGTDLHFRIVSFGSFNLTGLGEVADPFHIANNSGQVVEIVATALGTRGHVTLVDVVTFIAYGIRDVESEIVTAFLSRNP